MKARICILAALTALSAAAAGTPAGWDSVPAILARIQAPRLPDHDFPVTNYGAKADGATDCTEAIRQAIAACHAGGGGRVVVGSGRRI